MTVAFLLPTPVFLLDFLLFFFFHPLDLIPLDFTYIFQKLIIYLILCTVYIFLEEILKNAGVFALEKFLAPRIDRIPVSDV